MNTHRELSPIILPSPFPGHMQLPESDGTFVKNFQESLCSKEKTAHG